MAQTLNSRGRDEPASDRRHFPVVEASGQLALERVDRRAALGEKGFARFRQPQALNPPVVWMLFGREQLSALQIGDDDRDRLWGQQRKPSQIGARQAGVGAG